MLFKKTEISLYGHFEVAKWTIKKALMHHNIWLFYFNSYLSIEDSLQLLEI